MVSEQVLCRSRKESDELGRIHYGGVSLCSPGLNERGVGVNPVGRARFRHRELKYVWANRGKNRGFPEMGLGTLMSQGLDGTLLRCRFDSSNSDLCRDSYANWLYLNDFMGVDG